MKPKSNRHRFLAASFTAFTAVGAISAAQAATYYWNTTTTAAWTSGANWSDNATTGGTTGVVPLITDAVVFNQSSVNGGEIVQFNSGTAGTALGLTFANTGATTLASDGGSNRVLNVGTGGITILSGAGAVTIGNTGANLAILPVLNGGAQTWTNNSASLFTVMNTISNSAKTLTIDGTGDTTLNGPLDGTLAGLVKTGPGTLTLTAANSYGISTTINGGKIALSGGNDRMPPTLPVKFDGGNSSTATLDIGSTSQALGNITFPATVLTTSLTANINGAGGTLTLGTSDLQLGPAGNNALGTTINMSGLSNFAYNGTSTRTFRVGYQSGYGGNSGNTVTASDVTLANGTNTITAGTLAVNDTGGSSGAGNALLHLGTTNTINANTINMGTGGRSGATLNFATGLTSPTVKIRGTDTTSAVTTWSLGQVNLNGANNTWNQLADFSAGTIDANVTTMNVGKADFGSQSGRGGTDIATVIVGATTGANFTVGTLNLGYINGTSTTAVSGGGGSASGTFTLNSASGIVNASTVNFAKDTIADTSGSSKTVTGTFNLTNGTLNATTVQKDTDTGTATATVNFKWTTGTIGNIAGGNLAITGVPLKLLTTASHTFDISGSNTATLDANSPISGLTFGITKQGTGSLVLQASNTYTGATVINAGTLSLGTTSSITTSASLAIAAGAKLDTTAKASYALPAVLALGVDASGSSGQIVATGQTLDISAAAVTFNVTGTLSAPAYVLATYGSKTGAAFASATAPSGYTLNYSYNGGTQIALVQTAAGYSAWNGANAGGQTPSQDWDNDGVSNGVEYFMNAAAGFTASPPLVAAAGPSGTVTWTNGGNIPTSAYGPSGQYVVQTSSDLLTWTDVPVGSLTTNTPGPGGSLTYTLTGSGPRFVRLKVTPN